MREEKLSFRDVIFYVPGVSEPEKLDNLQRIAEEILPQVAG